MICISSCIKKHFEHLRYTTVYDMSMICLKFCFGWISVLLMKPPTYLVVSEVWPLAATLIKAWSTWLGGQSCFFGFQKRKNSHIVRDWCSIFNVFFGNHLFQSAHMHFDVITVRTLYCTAKLVPYHLVIEFLAIVQPQVNLPKSLQYLSFGKAFNQSLEKAPLAKSEFCFWLVLFPKVMTGKVNCQNFVPGKSSLFSPDPDLWEEFRPKLGERPSVLTNSRCSNCSVTFPISRQNCLDIFWILVRFFKT